MQCVLLQYLQYREASCNFFIFTIFCSISSHTKLHVFDHQLFLPLLCIIELYLGVVLISKQANLGPTLLYCTSIDPIFPRTIFILPYTKQAAATLLITTSVCLLQGDYIDNHANFPHLCFNTVTGRILTNAQHTQNKQNNSGIPKPYDIEQYCITIL